MSVDGCEEANFVSSNLPSGKAHEEGKGSNEKHGQSSESETSQDIKDEYPHGMRLGMIVVALVMTMFIVSAQNKKTGVLFFLRN